MKLITKKIFGKEIDNYLTSKDIFNDIDFKSHNKYILLISIKVM